MTAGRATVKADLINPENATHKVFSRIVVKHLLCVSPSELIKEVDREARVEAAAKG